MNQIAKSTLAFLLFSTAVHAQTTGAASGQWTGTTKSPSTGNELQIQVKISDVGGTWRYILPATADKGKANPCLGREFPLSIKTMPNSKMMFSVDGPSVITGCPSFTLTLERTDEQTLTGSFGDGRPAVLKKQ